MANHVEFPIRTKLVLLMSGMVIAATVAYLALAIRVFRDDKTTLIYELNASTVKTLAAETDTTLRKIADKIQLLTRGHRDASWTRMVLESEPDLVSYTLYENHSGWKPTQQLRNPDFLKLYGLKVEDTARLREQFPIPFEKVISRKMLVMNSTVPGGAPILTVAMAFEFRDGGAGKLAIATADLRMDRLLTLLGGRGVATAFLVDSEGRILAHPDPARTLSREQLVGHPIVREAVDSKIAFQMKRYEWKGVSWLGAYAVSAAGGIRVISQIEEGQAFRAARKLIQKTALFALAVITASLLLTGMMARTFTKPLLILVAATERLARWQFGQSIHVKTKDEIGDLARAFNSMASDLQAQHAQLEAGRAELELKVKERTATLEAQKKQLAESQDALMRTTRLASLGELAGAAAHEVLNPVNNMNIRVERMSKQITGQESEDVKLLAEIVLAWKKTLVAGGMAALEQELKKPANDGKTLGEEDIGNLAAIVQDELKRMMERKEDLDFLAKEMIRITRIVNNMRALSRVGGERRPLDIHQPIDETSNTLADLFEKRKIRLIKDFSADPREQFSVIGDKDELVQVFANLIRNAVHAVASAQRRAGEIRVSTRRAGARVEVRIQDNGTGISVENMARIFEPNFTTKSVAEGTGLGLSISRRIVRAFGGDIEIESAVEGEGTTFLVWIPAAT